MTTIIINEKTKKGKIILQLIQEMKVGKIIDNKQLVQDANELTLTAIKDAKQGRTIKCSDFDDYLEKVK